MDLSIIIVNWNSKNYLFRCITSILNTTYSIGFEIVVIDSASFDGCGEMLRQCFPHVLFIQSNENLGFAKANNEAFRLARGRNVLFLNPDTEVEGYAIETLYRQLESLPDAGIVGARLLNSDRSIQTSCIQAFPTIMNQVLDVELLRKLFPNSSLWGLKPLFNGEHLPAEVDSVSGACLMIKKSVFEAVDMFSTDYFMYSEDVDLCFKVREARKKVFYVPTAVVLHHGGGSSSQSHLSSFSSTMMLESRSRFFCKIHSVWYARLYRSSVCLAGLFRIGMILFVWPIFSLLRKTEKLKSPLKKWLYRVGWALWGGKRVERF